MVVTKRNQRRSCRTTKFDQHFIVVVEVANYLEVESYKQLNLIHISLSVNAISFLLYTDRDADVQEADDTGVLLGFMRAFQAICSERKTIFE